MQTSVDQLMSLIGELHVQVRLLEQERAQLIGRIRELEREREEQKDGEPEPTVDAEGER